MKYAEKIKMKQGKSDSNDLTEIDEIYNKVFKEMFEIKE